MLLYDEVVLVNVLCAGAVSAEQNARAADVLDVVADDSVFLSMQVHPYCTAAAVDKVALLDGAVLGPAQTDQRVGLVVHVPIVLQAFVVLGQRIALAVHEGQAPEA
jgi:hypothetical protein